MGTLCTKANRGAGLRARGLTDDRGVVVMLWKTSRVMSTIDLLAQKADTISLIFSLKRLKFLGNLILSIGMEDNAGKK